MRGSDLKRAVEALGFTWITASGTSHFKIVGGGLQRPVPVSLHNGLREEIGKIVLRNTARQLGVTVEDLIRNS